MGAFAPISVPPHRPGDWQLTTDESPHRSFERHDEVTQFASPTPIAPAASNVDGSKAASTAEPLLLELEHPVAATDPAKHTATAPAKASASFVLIIDSAPRQVPHAGTRRTREPGPRSGGRRSRDARAGYQKFVASQGPPKLGTYMPNMLHISPVYTAFANMMPPGTLLFVMSHSQSIRSPGCM